MCVCVYMCMCMCVYTRTHTEFLWYSGTTGFGCSNAHLRSKNSRFLDIYGYFWPRRSWNGAFTGVRAAFASLCPLVSVRSYVCVCVYVCACVDCLVCDKVLCAFVRVCTPKPSSCSHVWGGNFMFEDLMCDRKTIKTHHAHIHTHTHIHIHTHIHTHTHIHIHTHIHTHTQHTHTHTFVIDSAVMT